MKEDYLWNKTGSDLEIEQMENALSVFRLDPKEPPALRLKPIAQPERRWFGSFKFGFAFACTLLIVILSIFLQMSFKELTNDQTEPGERVVASIAALTPKPVPVVDIPSLTDKSVASVKLRPVKPSRIFRTVARKKIDSGQPEKLTPEESYAYNQLMLALSITSSELKIVKNKINGREERNAADDRQR